MDNLEMTDSEQKAYDWALGQEFQSVAASYARILAQFIKRIDVRSAILAEREACAKICEDVIKIPDEPGAVNQHAWPGHPVMTAVKEAIRARSNTPETEKEIIVAMNQRRLEDRVIQDVPEIENKASESPDYLQPWIDNGF